MKRATILTILLTSALAFGQKFDVSDLSASDSPISFSGTAKVSTTKTTCMVTMHNDSTQGLLAVELTGEVTSPEGWNQSTELSYDHFFKEAGIPPGEDFDVLGPDFFDSVNQGPTYINGVLAILSHLVDAYDTGGEAGFAAALDEPESRSMAYRLKYEAAYFKVTVIDLVRKKLGAAQKRQASGIF